MGNGYHLVHIISNQEYKTPLIQTQVFDRAKEQASLPGENKPISVSVWIVDPIREIFDGNNRRYIARLKKQYPGISIRFIGVVSRLRNSLLPLWLHSLRLLSGKNAVVYHCRGESTFFLANMLAKRFRKDAIVLDVRGFWPLERHASKNVFDIEKLDEEDRKQYEVDCHDLGHAIKGSQMVTTVSAPLAKYLQANFNSSQDVCVVPCCVSSVADDNFRTEMRKKLQVAGKKAILYLGGTQSYQHLEDLVLPFLRSALKQSTQCVAVIITQNAEVMCGLIAQNGLPADRVKLLSVPQKEVWQYLTAMDAGLLLRAPSLLNTFAQPVKLGEYLSAGLPVITEQGTGEVSELLSSLNIGYTVRLTGTQGPAFDEEVEKALKWIVQGDDTRRIAARTFVKEKYTWKVFVPREREMYISALFKKATA